MTYEDYLDQYKEMTYRFKGISMLPLLKQDRDLFTVRRKEPGERFHRTDVVLYRRGNDHVLHRITKVLPDGHYVILGDNCVSYEYDTCDDDILGVMTSFIRKGKNVSVNNFFYRIYANMRVTFAPVRIFRRKVKSKLYRIAKKLLRRA